MGVSPERADNEESRLLACHQAFAMQFPEKPKSTFRRVAHRKPSHTEDKQDLPGRFDYLSARLHSERNRHADTPGRSVRSVNRHSDVNLSGLPSARS